MSCSSATAGGFACGPGATAAERACVGPEGRKERPDIVEPSTQEQTVNDTSQMPMLSEQSSNAPSALQMPQASSMPESRPEISGVPARLALLPNGVQHASPADAEQTSSNDNMVQMPQLGSDHQQQDMVPITDALAFKRAQPRFASSGSACK